MRAFGRLVEYSYFLEPNAEAEAVSLASAVRDTVNKRHFEECPYYYYRLIREALPSAAG